MRLKAKLMAASFKMFIRQREAIIWTMILPLFMVFLFSFVKFDGIGHVSVGVVNHSQDTTLVSMLRPIQALRISEGREDDELARLKKGDRAMVLVIPASFQPTGQDSLTLYLNAERPQETQAGRLILQRTLDELVFRQNHLPRHTLRTVGVTSRNLTYIDFLLPGILAMSIMQSGVFGVAFGFVMLKKRGILRRLARRRPGRRALRLFSRIRRSERRDAVAPDVRRAGDVPHLERLHGRRLARDHLRRHRARHADRRAVSDAGVRSPAPT